MSQTYYLRHELSFVGMLLLVINSRLSVFYNNKKMFINSFYVNIKLCLYDQNEIYVQFIWLSMAGNCEDPE